ncbi:MAG: DNA mismatch repair endonuclease MutL [Chloroflexota bacterium]|nr:DNA mismatch repair endonuclease MutL [Chloroflexota bacterium]
MSIRRLPPEISGKIAAGEVIERPASVVRELLDNALDAGARRIDVAVEQGGKALIQITDDGSGIPPDQVALAVERHSTSKLTTVDDLARIQTLGFRGEALASIAAVAELSLRSVTADGQPGREVLARDERVIEERPVGGARGTRVTVRGLFRTIPARLEFLKAERTELGHIVAAVTRAALGHPHVAFRLHDGHRERVRTPGDGDLRTALLAIYGATLVDELIELPPGETLGIDGFVSQPHLQRSSRADIALFVNGRWVSDRLLSAAVSEAYRSVMPTGRFPVIVLNLTIPPEEVDVNVHPSKAEVRFRRSGEVFRRLSATVRRALASATEIAPARLDRPVVDQFFFPSGNARWDSGPPPPSRHLGAGGGPPPPPDDQQPEPAPGLRSPVMRPLGQVENTYIVAAGPRGLYLIDQHAAHERVLFERLGNIADTPTQRLLDPTSVELSAEESDWVAAHADDLRTLGFDVTAFGPSAWLLRAVPSALGRIDAATYLREVVAEAQTPDFQRLAAADRLRWSLACGAAIKSGAPLAFDEMSALIRDLEACDLGIICPHGRPTVILLSRQLLDREFGRT